MGLALTVFGAFLAAVKGVVTKLFMVGALKLHPLDLLVYMSVYASVQLAAYLLFTGDLQASLATLAARDDASTVVFWVLCNGAVGWGGVCFFVILLSPVVLTANLRCRSGRVSAQHCVVQHVQADVAAGPQHWRHRQTGLEMR